jgi:glucan phosphoethanolaminetransferase (alkaline phosphatase superfamily)
LLQLAPAQDSVRHRYSVRALNTLLYVFFILMLSSFFFSVIAGEQLCRRAFAEGIYAAALFATAAVGTFLSICWLFALHQIGSERIYMAKAIMAIVIMAAWTHTALTVSDSVSAIEQPRSGDPSAGILWWGLALAAAPVMVGVLTLWPSRVRKWLSERSEGLFVFTEIASLAAAVLLLAGFSSTTMANPGPNTFPLVHRYIVMGILCIVFSLYLANMAIITQVQLTNPAAPSRRAPQVQLTNAAAPSGHAPRD